MSGQQPTHRLYVSSYELLTRRRLEPGQRVRLEIVTEVHKVQDIGKGRLRYRTRVIDAEIREVLEPDDQEDTRDHTD